MMDSVSEVGCRVLPGVVSNKEVGYFTKNGQGSSSTIYVDLDGKAHEGMDLTETETCLACDGNGSLLVCSENECGFAVHEKCLPCSAYFDESGSFYCPQCAYERAVEKCSIAKKRAALARQALLKFISRNDYQPEVEATDGIQPSPSTSERGVDHLTQAGEVRNNTRQNCDVQDLVGQVPEADNGEANGGRTQLQVLQKNDSPARPGSMEKRHDIESGPVNDMSKISTPTKRKRDADKIRGDARDDLHIEESDISDSDVGTIRNKKPNLKRHQKEQRAKCVQRGSNDSDIHNVNADGSVKESQARELAPSSLKNNSNNSDNQGKSGTSPCTRRRIQWTVEEVNTLKEGVQKFFVPNKNIPWGRILEYGSQVFHRSRAASDLKDKWRSLMK